MRDILAIVGSHPRTRAEFDFDRTDCDIWVFNEAMSQGWVGRADAVFQMHREEIWRNPQNCNDPKHAEWLKSGNTPPIIMQDVYQDVPQSEKYPLDDVCAALLPGLTVSEGSERYFTSSIAYAIALGIYRGYASIEIYGIEMETQTEYVYQRDGVTFWMGIALGNGVGMDVHSSMFDAPLYGYQGEALLDYSMFVERASELEKLLPPIKAAYELLRNKAVDAYYQYETRGENPKAVVDTMMAQIEAGNKYGMIDGALQEIKRYIGKADTMRAEAGGKFLFARQEFEQASKRIAQKRENAITLANTAAGACQVQFQAAINTKSIAKRRKVLKKFAEIAGQYIYHSIDVGLYSGVYQENLHMLNTLDRSIRAAGGAKAEQALIEAAMAAGA